MGHLVTRDFNVKPESQFGLCLMEIRKDFLPLSRPSIGEKEIEKVVSCLKSGWITTGPLCKAFEEKFCELIGATYALSLSHPARPACTSCCWAWT